jgi:hypothetical protein
VTEETTGAIGCIDGFKMHDYNAQGFCKRCGYEPRGSVKRPTKAQTASKKMEAQFTRQEAKEGISMLLLASQSVILAARPDLKEDALNPQERLLLSDALADEAFDSKTIHKYLAKLGQQKKHTKLLMVCMAIALPRLARRGIIPAEGMGELQSELVTSASSPTRPDGDTSGKPQPDWDTVPVESGGSPIPDRGNGIGKDDVGGMVAETAPLRDSTPNENGRSAIPDGRDSEIPSSYEEPTFESYRTKTRSSTRRSKAR